MPARKILQIPGQLVPGFWSPVPGLRSGPVGLPVPAPWPGPFGLTAHLLPQGLQKTHFPPTGTCRPEGQCYSLHQCGFGTEVE